MIRVLIADDEPLARKGVRARLAGERDVEIVGEAEDGPGAVEAIRRLLPDLVFLDIQMPGATGFDVLERLGHDALPWVVFITAYDVHALRAFEIHALDYLLKPYTEERFRDCLNRAREAIEQDRAHAETERLRELLDEQSATRAALAVGAVRYPRRFAVRDRNRIVFVPADELQAVEAAGNYVLLVASSGKHLLRLTLAEMEQQLDPARFTRIHRSTLVNVDRVREIRTEPHGDGDVVMEGGATYRMSRAHRDRLLSGRSARGNG